MIHNALLSVKLHDAVTSCYLVNAFISFSNFSHPTFSQIQQSIKHKTSDPTTTQTIQIPLSHCRPSTFTISSTMMKATSAILSNPRFALTGRHAAETASKAFSSRLASNPVSWTDVRDELKDLQHMLTEHKTNKAVPPLTDSNVVGQVREFMSAIQTNKNSIDHDQAFHRAHQLKAMVKDALYYQSNHSSSPMTGRRMMSTATRSQEMPTGPQTSWRDIDDEINQLKHVMQEHKTNHAVACPQAQLEELVRNNMDEIFHLQSTASNDWVTHDEAYRRVRLLKNMVKAELYRKDAAESK
jgi:hypothetical protein